MRTLRNTVFCVLLAGGLAGCVYSDPGPGYGGGYSSPGYQSEPSYGYGYSSPGYYQPAPSYGLSFGYFGGGYGGGNGDWHHHHQWQGGGD